MLLDVGAGTTPLMPSASPASISLGLSFVLASAAFDEVGGTNPLGAALPALAFPLPFVALR